jgi:hypothetical protein
LAVAAAAPCNAQDAGTQTAEIDDWHFLVGPYAWAIGINGDIGKGSRETSVDASFTDIVKASDSLVGLEGHAEAQYKRFGLFFDGIYADITASDKESASDGVVTADLNADLDLQLAILEAGTFYRVVDTYQLWHPSPDLGGGTFTFDALAGARYTYLKATVDAKLDVNQLDFKRDLDGSRDWVDPFVGGRLNVGLTNSADFQLRGDIGGFGVGSDFTWNTQALLGYRFTMFGADAEVWGGYRALAQDYHEGSGSNRFSWDVIIHGPVLGLAITW